MGLGPENDIWYREKCVPEKRLYSGDSEIYSQRETGCDITTYRDDNPIAITEPESLPRQLAKGLRI